jgi:hypothetical protein
MIYKPTPTGYKFHKARNTDSGFIRTIVGPFGSGKSVTCVMELMMIAFSQEPDPQGIRRTKFAIVRNTYRELLDTTMATFFTWVPKESGTYSALNMTFHLDQTLPDNTQIQAEFLFRALDKPDDIKKVLSLDLTAAWINEVREISKTVFDGIQSRFGRYPTRALGVEATFAGLITDTNPPDIDHWYYRLFEEDLPPNHKIFHQPSGLSPEAENIQNLPRNYYQNMSMGKTQAWIDVYVHGRYGFIADGRPVWPEYRDDVHHTHNIYHPDPRLPLFIGIDFGLTPAAVFGQKRPSGQFVIFDELCTWDMGAVTFGRLLKEKLNHDYKDFRTIEIYGDPAGTGRSQSDESTPFQMLSQQGIDAYPTYTNDFEIRREVPADYMLRLAFDGTPAFMIITSTGEDEYDMYRGAPTVRKACGGGYKYKRLQVTGEDRFHDVPDKNKYSHAGDALQYLMLGAVGGDRVMGGYGRGPIDYTYTNRTII